MISYHDLAKFTVAYEQVPVGLKVNGPASGYSTTATRPPPMVFATSYNACSSSSPK
jgi:hypothetical protein